MSCNKNTKENTNTELEILKREMEKLKMENLRLKHEVTRLNNENNKLKKELLIQSNEGCGMHDVI